MNVRSLLSVGRAIGRTGLLRPVSPVAYPRMAVLARRWGASPATGSAIAALQRAGPDCRRR